MATTRYQPTTELFRPIFDELLWPLAGNRAGSFLRAPDAEVVETQDEIRVVVELPGMTPQDIDLGLENNILTISGEKREQREESDERSTWHLNERRYGQFSRSFVLPRDVEQDRIQAHFDNGVLTVTVPKSERARRRHIEIQSGNGRAGGASSKALK